MRPDRGILCEYQIGEYSIYSYCIYERETGDKVRQGPGFIRLPVESTTRVDGVQIVGPIYETHIYIKVWNYIIVRHLIYSVAGNMYPCVLCFRIAIDDWGVSCALYNYIETYIALYEIYSYIDRS